MKASNAAVFGLVLAALVPSCGGANVDRPAHEEDVEVALYVAIQADDPRIVISGANGHSPLQRLYDISCQEAGLGTWACSVLIDNEPPVSCTIDRVRIEDDVRIDGRVHCKY